MAISRGPIGSALRELRVTSFAAGAPITVARIPDATVSLLFRARGGAADLLVLGPLTRARYKRAGGLDFTVRAILAPEVARAVVGVPLDELTDRIVKLDAVWSRAGALLDRMVGVPGEQAARELTAAVLARVPARRNATDALVARARALLDRNEPVAGIARQLGVNERHLRRAFADRTGLSPKRYARIARLQHLLARVRGRAADWGRLASELGYFDQAHLINDFRDLVAATPDAFDPAQPWPTVARGA